MPDMLEEMRAAQKKAWDAFAGGWDRWADEINRWSAPVTDAMIEALDAKPGDHVLDIATGAGEPALTIAERVGCRFTLTDLAPNMLAYAEEAAKRRGVEIVETKVAGGEDLPFEDDVFDATICRFGIMFMPDDAAAAREMRRVTKPSGRVVLAVWNLPDQNPWATVPMGIISRHVSAPAPDPDAPGIFRHGAPRKVEKVLEAAGFSDVSTRDIDVEWTMPTARDMWTMALDMAAPIAGLRASADKSARGGIDREVIDALGAYEVKGAIKLPGRARVVSARA